MKKQQVIAVVLISLLTIYSLVMSIRYYSILIEKNLGPSYVTMPVFDIIQQVIYLLMNLLMLLLCGIFLLNSNIESKDKAYRYIRFIAVINFFLYLPMQVLSIYATLQMSQNSSLSYFLWTALFNAIEIVIIVLLLKNKPGKAIQQVNLEEYELVAYTSGVHRFVHYLMDMLFLFPVLLAFISLSRYAIRSIDNIYVFQLMMLFIYLLYCFLSELIFKQTLGKMITNSCVVSSGTPLSAGRVFIRTLCRLIPFDGISFLFRANWHDNISSTSVVYVDTWQKVFEDK